ncbi:DUF1320 domain-containing protein [Pararoseomonas sp. SCSIO 73927]|uniref:gp436 family protein n=1 Tax=Pararoseomonas sp. SCSIO 73927 TaxID=3114537 RepID=UPI0030D5B475
MPYVDQAALEDRFGADELRQLAPDGLDGVDPGRVARACQDASNTADAYLAGRYALPLAVVPELLVRLTAAIARYDLHLGPGRVVTDQVKDEKVAAISMLKDIQARRADLDLPSGEAPAPEAEGPEVLRTPSRSRTPDSWLDSYRFGDFC